MTQERCTTGDEIVLLGSDDAGRHVAVRHTADHERTPCGLLPLREGQSIPPGGELVQLKQIEGQRYAVTSLYRSPGPAKVTSDQYRTGWDCVFGGRTAAGQA